MVQRLGGVESQTIPRRVALSCGFGSNCLGMGGVFCSEAGGRARISWFSDSAESKARQFHGVSHEHAGSGRIVSAWPIPPLESTHRHGAAEFTELAWAIPSNNFIASGSSSSP